MPSSWQIDGKTMETVADFIFLGFRITADGDFSHDIKRHLLLGRKAMTNLDSTLKIRNVAPTAKLLQSCLTLQPHRWQPIRLRHP